jgi:hypothetical protein
MSFTETLKELLGDNEEEKVKKFYYNYNHNRLKN